MSISLSRPRSSLIHYSSTSTPSSPQLGQMRALFTMSAKLWNLELGSQMLLWVVSPLVYETPLANHTSLQVVFKALIVLHTMIRAGSTDNVLSYLSSSNILKLRNISSASWEGVICLFTLFNSQLSNFVVPERIRCSSESSELRSLSRITDIGIQGT